MGLPIHNDINNVLNKRLRSRHPIWSIEINSNNVEDMWKQFWEIGCVQNRRLISHPIQRVLIFYCPKAIWTILIIIRMEKGKCNYILHKWKIKNSPYGDCGQKYIIRHIAEECPQTR